MLTHSDVGVSICEDNMNSRGNIEKRCLFCKGYFIFYKSDKRKFCSKKCYGEWLSKNIRGDMVNGWQGGLSFTEGYRSNYLKKYRHKKGISEGYNDGSGILYTKEYKRLDRQKYRLARQKYTAMRKKGRDIKIIQLVYEGNIKRYGTLTCYLCLKFIEIGKDNLEHKTPLSRGGTNEYENLAIACQRCNCRKHDKTEAEFRKGGF